MAATEHITLFATGGYLDAKFDNFDTDINPNDGIGTVNYQVGPGQLELYTKYASVDKIETDLLNLKVGELDVRSDLSGSIGYQYNNLSLVLYGNNLTDETYEIPFLISPPFASGIVTPDRSWGVSLSIDI